MTCAIVENLRIFHFVNIMREIKHYYSQNLHDNNTNSFFAKTCICTRFRSLTETHLCVRRYESNMAHYLLRFVMVSCCVGNII